MQRKTISLVLCFAMLLSMFVFAVPANAATVDSAAAGLSKIESADDFSWDNVNMYFLLTDRFYNGNTSNDHAYGRALDANGQPLSGWNTAPGTFHGGDFAGLTQKIEEGYFDKLGVNALWISAPYEQIHGFVDSGDGHFAHYSYHGYYVLDYTETDANFGTKEEFKTLVDTAHKHGIRVVMDIVMNHAGYNNIADMEEFNYGTITNKAAIDAYKYKLTGVDGFHSLIDYESSASDWGRWWGDGWVRSGLPGYHDGSGGDDLHKCLAGLPDFRTESTASVSIPTFLQEKWQKAGTYNTKIAKYGSSATVSDYLTTWLAEWVETYGVDGFRCDTAKHVELSSWNKLKTKCVAALNTWRKNNPTAVGADWDEDFWMTGECWGHGKDKSPYFTEGGFDSMINFSITSSTGGSNGMPDAGSINSMYQSYASDLNSDPNYNVLTYLSSHDTNLVRSAPYWQGTAFQLLPGGIQIFYGDETSRPLVSGLAVGGDGHAVRSDMNFGQNNDQLAHWQKVGKFRANHVAVGAGDHQQITAYNAATGYTFSRSYADDNVTDGVICCIGAPANQQIAVDVSSMWGNGKTVTNEYDGTTAVVQNGKATFNSGAQGVILISGPQSTIAMSVKGAYAFYDSETVTAKLRGADYATVSVNGGTPFRVVDGQTFEIGDGIEVGTVFEVKMTATNAVETSEKTFSFKKKDPNAVTRVYFDNSSYNWSNIKIYVYDKTEQVDANAAWPGESMTYDEATGLYVYEVPDELTTNGMAMFSSDNGRYPGDGAEGLAINETDMLFSAGNQWSPYNGQIVEPTDPPLPGTTRVIFFDNSSYNFAKPYCHVWKTENGNDTPYRAWPGIEMTQLGDNLYTCVCPAEYNNCLFVDGNNVNNKTEDLRNIPCNEAKYSGGQWIEVISEDPTQPTVPTQPTQPTQPIDDKDTILIGDADMDGKLTVSDVTTIQRHCAEYIALTGDAWLAADANQDKKLTVKDATMLQSYLAEYNTPGSYVGQRVARQEIPTQPTQPTQPTDPTQPTQPAGTRTIYLDNSKFGASQPYIYVWKLDTEDNMGAWPGVAMTNEGNNLYSYTCPEEYNCCIFCRDSSGNKISDDLKNIPYQSALYDGSWSDYSGADNPPVIPTSPTNPNPDQDTITLDSSNFCTGEEDFYAWTWTDGQQGRWVSGTGENGHIVFSGTFEPQILFVRAPKGETPSWDPRNIYNQTTNLDTQVGGTFTITSWYNGSWS